MGHILRVLYTVLIPRSQFAIPNNVPLEQAKRWYGRIRIANITNISDHNFSSSHFNSYLQEVYHRQNSQGMAQDRDPIFHFSFHKLGQEGKDNSRPTSWYVGDGSYDTLSLQRLLAGARAGEHTCSQLFRELVPK